VWGSILFLSVWLGVVGSGRCRLGPEVPEGDTGRGVGSAGRYLFVAQKIKKAPVYKYSNKSVDITNKIVYY
jgi:hypothetical protein